MTARGRRLPRLSPILLAGLVCAGASQGGESRGARSPSPPSVAAEHVRLHLPSGLELARVRVELAPHGMRLRDLGQGSRAEIVHDFAGDRVWLVDRGRRVAHALAFDDRPLPPDDPAPSGDGSFLGTEPCGGGEARAGAEGRWRGRAVSVWHCAGAAGGEATELLDHEHGIVVRRQRADGVVDELRDIRASRFPASHFRPSARLRIVDEHELLNGVPALGGFDETRAGEHTRP